jgi:dienelactone hydrolase
MTDDSDLQLADVTPKDVESFDTFNEFVGGGWSVLIGRGLPDSGDVEHEKIAEQDRDTYLEFTSVLRNKKHGEAVPTVFLMPKQWNKRVVVWADERGKQALWADDGSLASGVRKLIDAGYTVAAPDCYGTGEFTADGKPVSQQRLQKGPKIGPPGAYVGYTFGYNHSLLAQRAHDLLSVISYVRNHKDQPDEVNLVGVGGAGPWVLAARAIATGSVDRAAVDTRGFRFAKLNAFDDPNFVPGSVKYGDLPALAALSAPFPLWIAGEGSVGPPLVRDTYEALDHPTSLTIYDGASDDTGLAAAMWIVEGNVE